MGFHPKNGLHQCMKVRLSIWTLWNFVSKTVGMVLKPRIKSEEINFEDLGH